MGNVLDVQINAAGSTYVADNPRLCLEAALQWTYRMDSYVEHSRSQVGTICGLTDET